MLSPYILKFHTSFHDISLTQLTSQIHTLHCHSIYILSSSFTSILCFTGTPILTHALPHSLSLSEREGFRQVQYFTLFLTTKPVYTPPKHVPLDFFLPYDISLHATNHTFPSHLLINPRTYNSSHYLVMILLPRNLSYLHCMHYTSCLVPLPKWIFLSRLQSMTSDSLWRKCFLCMIGKLESPIFKDTALVLIDLSRPRNGIMLLNFLSTAFEIGPNDCQCDNLAWLLYLGLRGQCGWRNHDVPGILIPVVTSLSIRWSWCWMKLISGLNSQTQTRSIDAWDIFIHNIVKWMRKGSRGRTKEPDENMTE